MNKTIYRIASVIVALAMILGNIIHTRAAGNAYYVSPTGSDTNPGTAAAPFKTFAKANSMLTAGSTLHIYAGVYNQQLKISKSGTGSAGITIQPIGGAVVIDMQNTTTIGMDIRASYVTVTGLEIMNSKNACVSLTGGNITLNGLVVHDCANQGIQATSSANAKILNSRVYRTVLSNAARSTTSGWGSAIRIRSDNVLVQGNIIYNNYGEGIVMRGTNITVRANTLYDNYAYNIYANNSENALVERNLVYCTTNSGYEFQGAPAAGIGMGEEYVEGWGARLKNAKVLNNIVAFCKHGFRYKGADDRLTGGGLKNATIAFNTLYGSTDAVFNIAYEDGQSGSVIANNLVWQGQNKFDAIKNPAGLSFQNNLWNAQPPAALQNAADKIGEPGFSGAPGFTAESYLPAASSLAAGAAVDIGVTSDYFARQRGPSFDIGAIQFGTGGGAPAPQATATASPTSPTILPTNTLPPATSPTAASPTSPVVQPTSTLPPATSQATSSPVPTSIQPTNTVTAPTITPTSVLPTLAPTQAPTRVPPTATATTQPTISAPPSTGTGMWITSSEIMALPTSGAAWDRVKTAAYGSWGTADLTNQDNKHDLNVLAGAFAYARTGDPALRSKVRDGVLAAKRSLDQSSEWQTDNGVLATGRQLGAYVIAADLIDLKRFDSAADNEFRSWLSAIRTTEIGTHGRWRTLTFTCENAAANWSAFACASRIAASIYLGDTADVDRAANIMRAAFGERSAYPSNAPGRDGYFAHASSYDASWACDDANWIAINPSCVKNGINIDGALVEDASRGGSCCVLQGDGMMYSKESLQGFFFSAELLYRTGRYGNPYTWSNQALKRAIDFMQRSGWEFITFVPWLANDRYGTSYPQPEKGNGRIMSWGDWLYQR
ncbi:MAG TPA: right-handed parallel beta-helix repeat-containing protein [Anaerolineales bacterium]|nr:right-handed parallel beta-helix repeat-containing protein [Anaerolineales bacterium]